MSRGPSAQDPILLRFTRRERGLTPAGDVCQLSAAGSTPHVSRLNANVSNGAGNSRAQRRRGPSMYEIEGPRLRPAALASRLLGRRALRDACLAALSKPIAQMPCAAWRHRCQIPDVRAGRPALPSFPRFPLGRIPSSVVRDFYCQSAAAHKTFPQELQDSLAIHRTSVVYPLCTAAFHRLVHSFIHRSRGLPTPHACRTADRGWFSRPTDSARRARSEAGTPG